MSGTKTSLTSRTISTPLGDLFAQATSKGVCHLQFEDSISTKIGSGSIGFDLPVNDPMLHLTQLEGELAEYFAGKRSTFSVGLDLQGTDFQQKVWEALGSIPAGETISYSDQARRLRNPAAIRAIASANGANPVAIVIPCHRVIGSNGKLTGYMGGLEKKRWLLEHERSCFGREVGLFGGGREFVYWPM